MYVSTELIGLLGSTIALGGLLFAAGRAIRGDLKAEVGALRKGMGAGDAALSEEIGAFRAEMKADHQALRGEMHAGDAALSMRRSVPSAPR